VQTGDVTIRTLFDADVIAARNRALAEEIKAADFDKLLVIAVLKGSFIFAADLIRAMHEAGLAPEVEFVSLSSYRDGTVSSGTVTIMHDIESDVRGRDVLLVDDIFDTGHTLEKVVAKLHDFGPASVRSAVLLRKEGRQESSYEPDFTAFNIPDEFVVGYGLDYEDMYRNLPYLAALESDDLEKHRSL
jgi:hypoxanthine phosphoribosyltransferase